VNGADQPDDPADHDAELSAEIEPEASATADADEAADADADADDEAVDAADGVEVPDAADFYDDDEVFPWEADDYDNSRPGQSPQRRKGGAGTMIGAAMMGLRDILYGKPKEETPIEIEASGDPPNVDLDGLDVQLDENRRAVGPPLDEIKARAVQNRRARRRPRS
jgi:hypothetical protein